MARRIKNGKVSFLTKISKKRKRKKTNRHFNSATRKAIGGIVTAGIVLPLTFTAIKKGGEALGGIGEGVEKIAK